MKSVADIASLPVAHRVIPGGAHTYSKGDDQFPANAPRFIERGEGVMVWDDEGKPYLDWTMGLRSVTLGYSHPVINQAAIAQLEKGSVFGRPSTLEHQLAEDIVSLIPSIDMVKFCKNGSTANTAAVKLARAYTGKKYVAFCKDHPFFSYDDWFIGKTPLNVGVPDEIADLSLTFHYNHIESLKQLFAAHPDEIAAVILEPSTTCSTPCALKEGVQDCSCQNFLQQVEALCKKHGTVFILDEVITGFRWHLQGGQTYYGVTPDLTTFGKGIANGHSVAVLGGRKEIMNLGGIYHDQRRVFLVSTTYGAENHSLAAARAAIQFYRENPVVEHLWHIGAVLKERVNAVSAALGLTPYFSMSGMDCRPEYSCKDQDGQISLPLRTLFLQEMVKRGILFNYIVPSYSHTLESIETTVNAVEESLHIYAKALKEGWETYLVGDPIKPVFRTYN